MSRFSPFAGGIAYAALVSTTSYSAAADLSDRMDPELAGCAVSAPNAKIEGAGGSIHSDDHLEGDRFFIAGAFSMPLGCEYGFQIDGSGGKLDGVSSWSVAGHLFRRDPSSYLLGIYGEFTDIDDNDVGRIAVEGELYHDNVTFAGLAGYEDSDRTDDDFFAAGHIALYATENLMFTVGAAHFLDTTAGTVGVEWQPDGTNMSLFADGAFGDDDYSNVVGGIRFYFGEQKPLMRRHREDDPWIWSEKLKRRIFVESPTVSPPAPPGPPGPPSPPGPPISPPTP